MSNFPIHHYSWLFPQSLSSHISIEPAECMKSNKFMKIWLCVSESRRMDDNKSSKRKRLSKKKWNQSKWKWAELRVQSTHHTER